MNEELERFVASLAIPADRKAIVLAELLDHAACAAEAAIRDGEDPDAARRAALGNLDLLRRSLEAVEPGFRVTRLHALVRGLLAGTIVAIVIAQGGALVSGVVGALVALAIVAVAAPPRALDLLRAELRAPRIRGTFISTIPTGPALAYCFTVLATPFVVWIGMFVARAIGGTVELEVPLSAFAIMTAVLLLLTVEGIRARRPAVG